MSFFSRWRSRWRNEDSKNDLAEELESENVGAVVQFARREAMAARTKPQKFEDCDHI